MQFNIQTALKVVSFWLVLVCLFTASPAKAQMAIYTTPISNSPGYQNYYYAPSEPNRIAQAQPGYQEDLDRYYQPQNPTVTYSHNYAYGNQPTTGYYQNRQPAKMAVPAPIQDYDQNYNALAGGVDTEYYYEY